MKRSGKLIASAVAMVLGLGAGMCSAKTTTISVLIWGSGGRVAILKTALKSFEASTPGVKVNLEAVAASSWADYYARVITRTAAGASPDLACVAIEGTRVFAAGGWAIPLNPYIKGDPGAQAFLKDVPQSVKDGLSYRGQLLGMPRAVDTILTNYNTDLVERAGLKPPSKDWDSNEFLDYLRKLTKDTNGDGKREQFGCGIDPSYFMNHGFLMANDGAILNDDWTASTANSEGTVATAELFQKISYEFGANSYTAGGGGFDSGKTAMMFHGRYIFPGIPVGMKPKWAVQVLPKLKRRATVVGLDGYMVLKGSKNPSIAFKVAKFLTSDGVIEQEVVKFGQSLPASRTLLTSKALADMPPRNSVAYMESLDMARPVPSPARYQDAEALFLKYMGLVLSNKKSPRDAMNQLHVELTKVMIREMRPKK